MNNQHNFIYSISSIIHLKVFIEPNFLDIINFDSVIHFFLIIYFKFYYLLVIDVIYFLLRNALFNSFKILY